MQTYLFKVTNACVSGMKFGFNFWQYNVFHDFTQILIYTLKILLCNASLPFWLSKVITVECLSKVVTIVVSHYIKFVLTKSFTIVRTDITVTRELEYCFYFFCLDVYLVFQRKDCFLSNMFVLKMSEFSPFHRSVFFRYENAI